MSWAEENGVDIGFYGYPNLIESYANNQNNIWITKDNQEIRISEMTDSHLYFAYRKFNDNRLAREMLLRLFKKASEK